MLKKMPLLWVLVSAISLSGLIPFVAVAIAGNVIVGGVALLAVVVGITWGLETLIIRPLRQLSEQTKALETAVERESMFPNLIHLRFGAGVELESLAMNLQNVGSAFQKRLTELNSIHAISQTITSSTLDFSKTVKAVLAAVQKVVDYDAAEVSVLRGNTLVVEAWWGKDGFKDTTGRKYRPGKGPTGIIAETKAPLFLSTVQPSEDLQRTIGYASVETEFIAKTTKLIINSFLGIPLVIGDRIIGTLGLVHHEPGFFTEDNMRQLNKLADHASIAIDNAIQVQEREASLRQQIQDLRIEIDQAKLVAQVEEVTDTEYFRRLQANAAKMRQRQRPSDEENNEESINSTNVDSESEKTDYNDE